jgi:hypothetical protein
MLRAQSSQRLDEINRRVAVPGRRTKCKIIVHCGNVDSGMKVWPAHQLLVKIKQHQSKPTCHASRVLQSGTSAQRALQAVLDKIISGAGATCQRCSIPSQSGKVRD